MPIKQHKQNREDEIESLSAIVQLQCLLFGSSAREQNQADKEQEQMAACPYCGDAGPQGLPCNQCGVDGMVYNDSVDVTYMEPEYNVDAKEDDADDKEETETTRSEHNPMWMRCIQGPA